MYRTAPPLMLVALLLSGCATHHGPTRGWSATVRREHPAARQFAYFELQRDGTLIYVAGQAAAAGDPSLMRPTWRGVLDATEASALADLLDGWDAAERTERPADGGLVYRLRAQRSGELLRTMDTGPSPFADALFAAMNAAQRARRDAVVP